MGIIQQSQDLNLKYMLRAVLAVPQIPPVEILQEALVERAARLLQVQLRLQALTEGMEQQDFLFLLDQEGPVLMEEAQGGLL